MLYNIDSEIFYLKNKNINYLIKLTSSFSIAWELAIFYLIWLHKLCLLSFLIYNNTILIVQ